MEQTKWICSRGSQLGYPKSHALDMITGTCVQLPAEPMDQLALLCVCWFQGQVQIVAVDS